MPKSFECPKKAVLKFPVIPGIGHQILTNSKIKGFKIFPKFTYFHLMIPQQYLLLNIIFLLFQNSYAICNFDITKFSTTTFLFCGLCCLLLTF